MPDAAPADTRLTPYPKISARGRPGEARVRSWIAVEKVHGAHFAVVCDGAGVRPAKRRELLGDDTLDDFFGVSRMWPGTAVAAGRFADSIRRAYGPAAVVTIYGELAGGRYPHVGVPAVPGVEPVQTGVWYAPDLRWVLFDATVETDQGRCWISDRSLREAADTAGLACVPALARGPLSSLHDLSCVFLTRLPGVLGLPELPDNLAEGYVLKPAEEWWEPAPGERGARERPMVKVKQKAFAEDERFSGSRPYLPPPEGAAGVPGWLVVEASALLTPARAASAVSKLGPRTPPEAVAAEIVLDVVQEVSEALGGLEDALVGGLERALGPAARALALFDAADRGGAPQRP